MTRRLKVILPLAVLLFCAGAVALMIAFRPKVEPEPRVVPVPIVRTITVHERPHQFTVFAQGSVTPRTDIQLVAEVSGRVDGVSPSFVTGGFFEADETLLRIDSRDYEVAVIRARAALAEAELRLSREQAEADVARDEWNSLGTGEPGPLVLREPQLAEARAGVESARASLKQAELDLSRCLLKAPFAGRVWDKQADVGQFIAKGARVARIYAVDFAEVRLPLPLNEVGYLDLPLSYRGEEEPDSQPEVCLRARFGKERYEWRGRIVRTEGEIDPRTRMLTVVARVDDPYGRSVEGNRPPLSVGLFVDAEIKGKSAGKVFLVPRAGLDGKDRAMVVDEEERLQLQPVEIIRIEGENAVVRSGLHDGDRVCISPLDAPVDGMRVRLLESDGAGKTSDSLEAE